jgi:serine/threonine protein kinase/tetratricopeptide (TPR) repeat protein/WD40 repeat protein
MGPSSSGKYNLLDELAAEFAERFRRGERPSLREYQDRFPELADDIQELFPALVEVEQADADRPELAPDGETVTEAPPLRQVGDYRILREIGRGGMGVVYEAEQVSLGRRVALKILSSHGLGDAKAQQRFRREARSAARLHHTNIVPVFEVGQDGDICYYAMQLIHGQGLDQVIGEVRRLREFSAADLQDVKPATARTLPQVDGAPRSKAVTQAAKSLLTGRLEAATQSAEQPLAEPPSFPQPTSSSTSALGLGRSNLSGTHAGQRPYFDSVARVGLQTALALAHAHARGILHRDVKPSNLLLDESGVVWVTDFGLAKTEDDNLTRTGDMPGTLRYMAPERFHGQCDARADLYALGLTLYELLVLAPAYTASHRLHLIEQIRSQDPPRLRTLDPRVPRDLETVVLKAIDKDPRLRYQSAEDLAEDLRRFLADEPIQARRTRLPERLGRWCRRNPAVAGLLAAVFLSLLLGTIVASAFAFHAEASARQAQQDRDKAREAEREGRRKLFEAYLAEAKANRLSRRTGQRFETLARVADAAALARDLDVPEERLAELRLVAVTALAMPDLSPRYLGAVPENATITDLSDDLTRVLLWDATAKTHVIRSVGDGEELFRLPGIDRQFQAFFGPRGHYIVRAEALEGAPVEVWKMDGRKLTSVRKDRFAVYWPGLHFRPDSSILALPQVHGALVIWDLQNGTEINRLPDAGAEREPMVALHPTEPLVASCSYFTTHVLLRDYQTGQTIQKISPPWTMGCSSVVWHPGGRRLFVSAGDSNEVQEYAFDPQLRELRPLRLLRTPLVPGGNILAVNPAGDRLASRGWNEGPGLLDLETGQLLFQARSMQVLNRFHFAADGRSLIGTYGLPRGRISYGVVSVGDAREVRTIALSGSGSGWQRPVVHPNGRLAVVPQGDHFTFVDLATLRELGEVKRGSRRFISVAFDGDGSLYTNSFEGYFRWPVRLERESLTVGPPERLPFTPGSGSIAVSADGRTVAQAQYAGYGMAPYAGGWLLTPDRPNDPFYLDAGVSMDATDISRDGRWVVFGVHLRGMNVYDSRTSRHVWKDMDNRLGIVGRFTPDGRWLVGGFGACRVGDWNTTVVLDPSHTGSLHDVSPDSRLALIGMAEGYARLIEIATGRELVRIEPPDGSLGQMTFTPDGTRLLERCAPGLRIWDLRRIRHRLADFGLDWDGPAYAPESTGPLCLPAQLTLTVSGGELLSDPTKLSEYERGLTLFRLAADCFDAQGNLDHARWLIQANRHAEALPHLQLALLSRPESYAVRMNKGLCLLRLGRVEDAVPEFTAAARARPEDHRPRYQRAQAFERLGRHAEAADDLTAVLLRFPEDAELYQERAACYKALGDRVKEASDRAAMAKWLPRSARGLNERAWRLLTGPLGERDAKKGLELIRKAVALEPDEAMFLNTLGVALYRNDRWTEAITSFENSLAHGKGKYDAFDLFFLAMCHAKLGDAATAKDCFDRAVKWFDAQRGLGETHIEELKAFRAEAAEVIRSALQAK